MFFSYLMRMLLPQWTDTLPILHVAGPGRWHWSACWPRMNCFRVDTVMELVRFSLFARHSWIQISALPTQHRLLCPQCMALRLSECPAGSQWRVGDQLKKKTQVQSISYNLCYGSTYCMNARELIKLYSISSVESQKGVIADQRCPIENQKGAIAIHFVQQ